MAQEQTLRRQLWGSAVSLALSQRTGEESSGAIGNTAASQCRSEAGASSSSSSSGSASPAESPTCSGKSDRGQLAHAGSISSWDFDPDL